MSAFDPNQRGIARAASLLLFLALLSGGYLAAAMSGAVDADVGAVIATHLNGLFGALMLFALGWSMPMMRFEPVNVRRVGQAMILSTYANFLVTGVKALLHVKGVAWTGDPANDAVFVVLNTTVVAPGLIGAFAWFWALRDP